MIERSFFLVVPLRRLNTKDRQFGRDFRNAGMHPY
jgi:hypothetical protein